MLLRSLRLLVTGIRSLLSLQIPKIRRKTIGAMTPTISKPVDKPPQPTDWPSWAEGFGSCLAMLSAGWLYIRKQLGKSTNGNGNELRHLRDELDDLRDRMNRMEILAEIDRRHPRSE